MSLFLKSISLNLPFGIGGVTLEVSEAEQNAAWALYVQLATRIISRPLGEGEGSVAAALRSIYDVFDITRRILSDSGREVCARDKSFGPIAIWILNEKLAPFLTTWHTKWDAYHASTKLAMMREHGVDSVPDAAVSAENWLEHAEFYRQLKELREQMATYVSQLATIAEVSQAKFRSG